MAQAAPIDPDLLFSQIQKTDGTPEAILAICERESIALLRRAANFVHLPTPDGVTCTPSAWRNREASKEALAAALAEFLSTADSPTTGEGLAGGVPEPGENGGPENIRPTCPECGGDGSVDNPWRFDCRAHDGDGETLPEPVEETPPITAEAEEAGEIGDHEDHDDHGGDHEDRDGDHGLPEPETCYCCDQPATHHNANGGAYVPMCDACGSRMTEESQPESAEAEEVAETAEEPAGTEAEAPEPDTLPDSFFEEDEAPFNLPEIEEDEPAFLPDDLDDEAPETAPDAPESDEATPDDTDTAEEVESPAEGDGEGETDTEGADSPADDLLTLEPRPVETPADLAETIARAVASHLPQTTGTMDESRIREIATAIAEDLDAQASDTLRDWTREQIELEAEALRCSIGTGISDHASKLITEKLDECANQIAEQVQGLIAQARETIRVEVPGQAAVDLNGVQHGQFKTLLNLLAAGLHVMLVGPSGSGKTHGCEQAAEALSLPFYCVSVGAQTTLSQIMGYMDAQGRYVRTVFRDAYEKGGVFLLDEIDAGNPNVLTALNAALANRVCAFPDGMVAMSPLFRCVAAANTFGNGQDRQYVGRNQLDATSLDRFATLEWNYDENMERRIAGFDEWVEIVHAVRHAVIELDARHIVSPRASIAGAKLLLQGAIPVEQIMDLLIWKGMESSLRAKIMKRSQIGHRLTEIAKIAKRRAASATAQAA